MTAVIPFDFDGNEVRTLGTPDEPLFVAADVAKVLGYSATAAMTRRLDDEDKGVRDLHTLGGTQTHAVITESGLYAAIIGSQVDGARRFKRWVTTDVLPAIRKTGSYSAPESREQLIARALIESQSVIAEKDQRIAELEPSARAWDELADASGDYDTRAAAHIIARGGVDMGQNRLRNYLRQIEWTDRNNRPYQRHVQAGRLAEKVRRWENRESGEVHIDHQLRVTAKGVGELLAKLSAGGHLQVVS